MAKLPSYLCGYPNWKDGVISAYGYIPHTDPSLTIKFTSNMDSRTTDESLGVRDVHLYLTETSVGSSYICGIGNGFPISNQETCKCSSGQYEVSLNNCVNCDDACLSCFGGGPGSCYRCSYGYYFNGTDCTNCDTSCATCGGPDSGHCMSCLSGYILYNGSCIFCPSGIIFEGFCIDTNRCVGLFTQDPCTNFCISPCDDEPTATWNESCLPPCLGLDIPDLNLTCKGEIISFLD